MLLDQHGLNEQIGRCRLARREIADQHFGFGIAWLCFERLQPVEKSRDEFTFLILHDSASCPFGSRGTANVVVRPSGVKSNATA